MYQTGSLLLSNSIRIKQSLRCYEYELWSVLPLAGMKRRVLSIQRSRLRRYCRSSTLVSATIYRQLPCIGTCCNCLASSSGTLERGICRLGRIAQRLRSQHIWKRARLPASNGRSRDSSNLLLLRRILQMAKRSERKMHASFCN